MGWSFSAGVMYMGLFINLDPTSSITRLDSNISYAVGFYQSQSIALDNIITDKNFYIYNIIKCCLKFLFKGVC